MPRRKANHRMSCSFSRFEMALLRYISDKRGVAMADFLRDAMTMAASLGPELNPREFERFVKEWALELDDSETKELQQDAQRFVAMVKDAAEGSTPFEPWSPLPKQKFNSAEDFATED